MTFHSRFALVAACLLLATPAMAQSPPAPAANVWLQTVSDVPAEKDIRFGVLPNGMRYAIMKNATPPGQASLRLRFDAGSLMEKDDQQGLAHFLEHMAFNGSKKVPEGEMVKILERHGLAFGADTNAQTSWTQTVYQLDLPNADDDTVDTSLMLLRQAAGELTLAQGAIDREKGVVLSEERARDTPGYRVLKQSLSFFLPGQLVSQRFPIGQVPVIQGATHALIDDFYNCYYRPERATLIAIGDFDVDAMEAKVKAQFGDWTGQGAAGPDPDLGSPETRGLQAKAIVEPGAPLSIQIDWVHPVDDTLDTKAKRTRKLIEQLGLAVLNRRLQRIARADKPPFIQAAAYKDDLLHSAETTSVSLAAQPDQWREALTAAEQEVHRIVQYGVRQDELDREISEYRTQLQSAVAGQATRHTPSIANQIVDALDDREVYTSPAEDLALFDEGVKGLTADTVSAALTSSVFSGDGPLVFMASPQTVEGGDATLLAAFKAAEAAPVAPPAAATALKWPYTSFGAPGTVAKRTEAADLGTTFVTFQNGVRLTVKPTKFRDDEILVRVRIGHGMLALPKDKMTTAWAARGAFTEGGLGKISAEDMERVLAPNLFGASFASDEDAFVLQGQTRPQDLDVQMQVLAAYASDPGFRPEAFVRMRTYGATLNEQMEATASGVLGRDLAKLLHDGDPRFAFPTNAEIASGTPEAFKALFGPDVASGPIEVTIIGDTTVDKAVALTAATFGALPPRDAPPVAASERAVKLPAPAPAPVMLTHKGRPDQAIAFAEWPSTDFFADPQEARTLRVLAQVIELRLIDDLREAAGDTYSPQAGATASLVFPGYGYVSAVVEIPPGKVPDFYADLAKISADLRANPVSADELERAKKPLVDSLEKARNTNSYWLEQLSGAQADPRRLDAVRSVLASLQSVGAADLQKAARAYLRDDKLWTLQVTPQAAAKPAATAAPAAG